MAGATLSEQKRPFFLYVDKETCEQGCLHLENILLVPELTLQTNSCLLSFPKPPPTTCPCVSFQDFPSMWAARGGPQEDSEVLSQADRTTLYSDYEYLTCVITFLWCFWAPLISSQLHSTSRFLDQIQTYTQPRSQVCLSTLIPSPQQCSQAWVILHPLGTPGNVWRHFRSSQLEAGVWVPPASGR